MLSPSELGIHGPRRIGRCGTGSNTNRATLARRFADVVGQSPMEFLTQWRLTLAADLLLDPQETVASVARTVGYSSPYALSAAFKRVRGVSPRQHRTAQRPRVAAPSPHVHATPLGRALVPRTKASPRRCFGSPALEAAQAVVMLAFLSVRRALAGTGDSGAVRPVRPVLSLIHI